MEDGVPTGDGVVKASLNIKQGDSEIYIQNYLAVGTNNVRITCTDQYGDSRSLAYTVIIIELSISSTFDATIPYSGDITFKCIPVGIISKTIHYVLDGKEIANI